MSDTGMKYLSFDNVQLEEDLRLLSGEQRILFGLACCERMLPNYKKFQEEFAWGNADVLVSALDRLWKHLQFKELQFDEIKIIRCQCEDIIPNTEDFDSFLSTIAQESVFSTLCVYEYICKNEVERIAQAASFAVDTADMCIQEFEGMSPDEVDREEAIRKHPIMQGELQRQKDDLEALRGIARLDSGVIQNLKRKWSNQETSNVGF